MTESMAFVRTVCYCGRAPGTELYMSRIYLHLFNAGIAGDDVLSTIRHGASLEENKGKRSVISTVSAEFRRVVAYPSMRPLLKW
jgi:hypothetical protein